MKAVKILFICVFAGLFAIRADAGFANLSSKKQAGQPGAAQDSSKVIPAGSSSSWSKTGLTVNKPSGETDSPGKTQEAAITTIDAVDQDGKAVTVDVADVSGLTSDWLKAAGFDASTNTVKVELGEDGKIKTLSIYDKDNNIISKYDPSSHLMEHYHTDGDLKGKVDYVTSELTRKYTWRDTNAKDPGMGKDKHVVVQKYAYDEDGNIKSIEYYTWTAGNRKKTKDEQKYSRYMYRKDTFVEGEKTKTEYFNDPRPTFWEPTVTGTVSKDAQGRIFLNTQDGKSYLLTARKDGFDADGDGKVGADEMSAVDWDSYVGKEITVRGHQIQDENEADVYSDGKKAEMFGVVDVVQTDKDEKLIDGWETVGEKVTSVMDKFFIQVGDEKDVNTVYDKIYKQLADDLKKAGISDADIEKFADASMKTKWAKSPDLSKYTDSTSLLAKAWDYSGAKDWTNTKLFSDEVIARYTEDAKTQQASLTGYAASGKEADYWALNDVATAHYILGTMYIAQKDYEKAKEELNKIIKDYSYAQCYDPKGWWWKLKDGAQEQLDKIE